MLRDVLGLKQSKLKDFEIMAKINRAQKMNLGEVNIIEDDGTKIRILLPKKIDDDFFDAG